MRDEKEGEKKQARANKQQGKATQHTHGSHMCRTWIAKRLFVYTCTPCEAILSKASLCVYYMDHKLPTNPTRYECETPVDVYIIKCL